MPPGSAGKYLIARLRGCDVAAVGSQPEGAPRTGVWNTYVWVESADEIAAKVLSAGGRVVMDPVDVVDAGRSAVFTDPEGAAFFVWQAKRHKGARIVNEPGSLNFNSLNTRDAEGAKPRSRDCARVRDLESASTQLNTLIRVPAASASMTSAAKSTPARHEPPCSPPASRTPAPVVMERTAHRHRLHARAMQRATPFRGRPAMPLVVSCHCGLARRVVAP
jgi:hypothetical protein